MAGSDMEVLKFFRNCPELLLEWRDGWMKILASAHARSLRRVSRNCCNMPGLPTRYLFSTLRRSPVNSIVSPAAVPAQRPSAVSTILAAGLVSAALDLLFACVFYGIRNSVSPLRIFQSIGSGWFGKTSFELGWTSGAIGFVSHFAILIVAAGMFFAAAKRLPILTKQAFWAGVVYGAVIYVVMNYVVVPLSAAPHGQRALDATIGELCSHLFLVGLPISYIVRRYYRANA
jgi:uncharacterized membrane protein YagU involved in acid resistance